MIIKYFPIDYLNLLDDLLEVHFLINSYIGHFTYFFILKKKCIKTSF